MNGLNILIGAAVVAIIGIIFVVLDRIQHKSLHRETSR